MAAKKKAKVGRSPREIAKMWQKLEPQLAKKRVAREREGQTFTSITREEFEAKLKRVHLPMIVSQGWSPTAPPGGRINYAVQRVVFDIGRGQTSLCLYRSATAIRSSATTISFLNVGTYLDRACFFFDVV